MCVGRAGGHRGSAAPQELWPRCPVLAGRGRTACRRRRPWRRGAPGTASQMTTPVRGESQGQAKPSQDRGRQARALIDASSMHRMACRLGFRIELRIGSAHISCRTGPTHAPRRTRTQRAGSRNGSPEWVVASRSGVDGIVQQLNERIREPIQSNRTVDRVRAAEVMGEGPAAAGTVRLAAFAAAGWAMPAGS